MKTSDYTDTDIAKRLVDERNNSRLASYVDTSGNIVDVDLYNQALEHCVSYDDLKNGIGDKPPKTDAEIIESAIRTNPAMDACCGLYGHK